VQQPYRVQPTSYGCRTAVDLRKRPQATPLPLNGKEKVLRFDSVRNIPGQRPESKDPNRPMGPKGLFMFAGASDADKSDSRGPVWLP
jgi:hypothetical protein